MSKATVLVHDKHVHSLSFFSLAVKKKKEMIECDLFQTLICSLAQTAIISGEITNNRRKIPTERNRLRNLFHVHF